MESRQGVSYQVGNVAFLDMDDPEFEKLKDAYNYAHTIGGDDSVIGIWTSQKHGSELIALIYQGLVCKPV